MADLFTPFLLITLLVLIVLQAVERHIYARQMQAEQSRLITAFLSKNAPEYATSVKVGKQKPDVVRGADDEVDLTNASDEIFDKFIEKQNE